MGKLTTKSVAGWVERIDAARNELIKAAESGNRVMAAFAQADARAELLTTLKDEQIKARLLRITSPDLNMVELVNNPTDDDRVNICALALLSGFVPGEDQYAIFGGGFDRRDNKARPGKLYIKANGFRTLFAHLGIVPFVEVEHPEFADLGVSDSKGNAKKIWRVHGKAWCVFRGQHYSVAFGESNPIGLPGYETDNVAGIAAKAERRMLQSLWKLTSPVLHGDAVDDDGNEIVEVDSAPVAKLESPQEMTAIQRDRMAAEDNLGRAKTMVADNPDHVYFVRRSIEGINEASDAELLKEVGKLMAEEKARLKVSESVVKLLRRLYEVRQRELAGEV